VESELKMINSLRTGSALLHHLEPSYYQAMVTALIAEREREIVRETQT
jgi:hypothetical protein